MVKFDYKVRNERVKKLDSFVKEKKAECFVTSLPHIIYYFTGTYVEGFYVKADSTEFLYTSKLYIEDAEKEALIKDVICSDNDYIKGFIEKLKELKGKKAVIDTRESVGTFQIIKKAGLKVSICDTQPLRAVKDRFEIEAIKKSYEILEEAIEESLKVVREGITELELKAEIAYRIRKKGAETDSFEHIVVFGEKTSVPHARSSDRKLKFGDLILIDAGARFKGYCSDITRCFAFGKIDNEILFNYKALKKASDSAFAALEKKSYLKSVDGAARKVLKRNGLDKFFTHSLGHGLGLEIHESPYLAPKSKDRLEKGMVFTIEPGIYFEGKYGLRLENGIVMEEKPVKLSNLSEELIIL